MAYGVGQGLQQGVEMAGRFLIPAMQQKMDNEFRNRYLVARYGFGDTSMDDGEVNPTAATRAVSSGAGSLSFPQAQPKQEQVGRLAVPGMTPFRGPQVAPASPGQSLTPSRMGILSPGMILGHGKRRF